MIPRDRKRTPYRLFVRPECSAEFLSAILQCRAVTSSGPRHLLSGIQGQDKNLVRSEKKCCLLGKTKTGYSYSSRNNLGELKVPGSVLRLGFIFQWTRM